MARKQKRNRSAFAPVNRPIGGMPSSTPNQSTSVPETQEAPVNGTVEGIPSSTPYPNTSVPEIQSENTAESYVITRGESVGNRPPRDPEDKVLASFDGDKSFWPKDIIRDITTDIHCLAPPGIIFWSEMSKNQVDELYNVFMTRCRFATPVETKKSRKVWEYVAKERFKDHMGKVRKRCQLITGITQPSEEWKDDKCVPSWAFPSDWKLMVQKWMTSKKFVNLSKANKKNFHAGSEENGGIVIRHTGGSASYSVHKRKLENEKKRLVTHSEVFDHTHKKPKNAPANNPAGEYCSVKARVVGESYKDLMKEKYPSGDGESSDCSNASPPVFDPQCWLRVVGSPRKGRVFGLGDSEEASAILDSSRKNAPPYVPPSVIPEGIQLQVQSQLEAERQHMQMEMELKLNEQLEKFQNELQAKMDAKMDQMMRMLQIRMRNQNHSDHSTCNNNI